MEAKKRDVLVCPIEPLPLVISTVKFFKFYHPKYDRNSFVRNEEEGRIRYINQLVLYISPPKVPFTNYTMYVEKVVFSFALCN